MAYASIMGIPCPNSCISSLDIVHNMWINLALAFGNKIVLTADHVSIETTCASALPTRSRSSWEPYDPCAKVAQG